MENLVNPWDIRPQKRTKSLKNVASSQERLVKKLKKSRCLDVSASPEITKEKMCSVACQENRSSCLHKVNDLENIVAHDCSTVEKDYTNSSTLNNVANFKYNKECENNHFNSISVTLSPGQCKSNQPIFLHNKISKLSFHTAPLPRKLTFSSDSVLAEPNFIKRGSLLGCKPTFPDKTCTSLGVDLLNKMSSCAENLAPNSVDDINCFPEGIQVKEIPPLSDTTNHKLPGQLDHSTTFSVRNTYPKNIPVHNYVKLNLRQKIFSRKGSVRQRTLRRQIYLAKLKKKFGSKTSSYKNRACFKCGVVGHRISKCPANMFKSEEKNCENSAYFHKLGDVIPKICKLADLDNRFGPIHFDDIFSNYSETHSSSVQITNLSYQDLSVYVKSTLTQMGFSHFRPAQELIIMRILSGVSTLAVMPTGAGKSLCYQLPAVVHQKIHGTVSLVISPLISLMQDQVFQMNTGVTGAYLNSTQSIECKKEIIQNALKGQYAFLMIAPEAIVESDWLLQPGRLPPISFVCIDEAHCLADWSHHFRPSYLRVCNLLRKHLGVTCFLGLSATCTPNTIENICKNLGIFNPLHFIGDKIDEFTLAQPGYVQPVVTPLPSNLTITASMDHERDEALLGLLTSIPFSDLAGGILIYCASREQTERLASFVRTALQDVVNQIGRKRMTWTTAAYHAGQTTAERTRIQKKFMNRQIRVLVATCAFGMGLNKSDLQAVIHYSLTKSYENYIQEIGRVGRQQQASYCHAFLPPTIASDACEANDLRRHIFTNHIDAVILKRFLKLIFDQFKCTCRLSDKNSSNSCMGHVLTIDPQMIGEQLDIKPESLATILAYMELDPDGPLISIFYSGYSEASIDCYGGPNELAYASQRCLAVSGCLSLLKDANNVDQFNENLSELRKLKINLPDLFNRWGWHPNTVKQELKSLEWDCSPDINGDANRTYRTGINVTFSSFRLWLWVHGSEIPITSERLDACLTYLSHRLKSVESTALDSLERLMLSLGTIAEPSYLAFYPKKMKSDPTLESHVEATEKREQRSLLVHELIRAYFTGSEPTLTNDLLPIYDESKLKFHWPPAVSNTQISSVESSIRDFLRVHEASLHERITGRNLANIFHGISTPQFPATVWSKCRRYWRAHLDVDWLLIKKISTQELLNYFRSL